MSRVAVLLAVLLLSTAANATQFEYQILVFDKFAPVKQITKKLNELGKQGWELVSTEKHVFTGTSVNYRYHMKREMP